MDIDKILNVSNDTFRKTINKDDHGYLFDSQIETAKDIVRNLSRNTTRRNHVILAAKMQSGKTGVCNSVVNIISQTELEKEMMVNKYVDMAGLGGRGLSVHKLRHTAATLMYQHGNVDVLVLKEILGHENLGTTEIYTHIQSDASKNAVDSNPLANNKPSFKS